MKVNELKGATPTVVAVCMPTTQNVSCQMDMNNYKSDGSGADYLTCLRRLLVLNARIYLGRCVDTLEPGSHAGNHAHSSPTVNR